MIKFLLWCILLVLCWPLALLALILYPFVWLLLLPFRMLGIVHRWHTDAMQPTSFVISRLRSILPRLSACSRGQHRLLLDHAFGAAQLIRENLLVKAGHEMCQCR